MPNIDVQCHTIPRPVWAEIQKVAAGNSKCAPRAAHMVASAMIAEDPQMIGALDERIAILDEARIDMEVISTGISNAIFFEHAAHSADMARATNDEFSAYYQRYPDRYRFFASLPLPHARESVDELLRASKLPGFAGIMMPADFGIPLDDDSLLDVYEELNRARTLLFIHPNGAENPGRYGRWGLETMIGWPALNALALMELILGGICDRAPDMTVITPHLSGTLLYLVGRIERYYSYMRGPAFFRCREMPSWYMKRMYHDSVCFQHSALELARTMVGYDHILLASDFPWQCRERLRDCVDIVDTVGWPEQELAMVRGGTMERLLRERGYW